MRIQSLLCLLTLMVALTRVTSKWTNRKDRANAKSEREFPREEHAPSSTLNAKDESDESNRLMKDDIAVGSGKRVLHDKLLRDSSHEVEPRMFDDFDDDESDESNRLMKDDIDVGSGERVLHDKLLRDSSHEVEPPMFDDFDDDELSDELEETDDLSEDQSDEDLSEQLENVDTDNEATAKRPVVELSMEDMSGDIHDISHENEQDWDKSDQSDLSDGMDEAMRSIYETKYKVPSHEDSTFRKPDLKSEGHDAQAERSNNRETRKQQLLNAREKMQRYRKGLKHDI